MSLEKLEARDAAEANAARAEGAAERDVGRFLYLRVAALMDAAAGTKPAAELAYLAGIIGDVEEYGLESCAPTDPRSEPFAHPGAIHALKAISAVRPTNWDDDEDPDQAAAWRAVDDALRESEAASLPTGIEALRALSERAAAGPWFVSKLPTLGGLSIIEDGRQSGMYPVKGEAHEIAFIVAAANFIRQALGAAHG